MHIAGVLVHTRPEWIENVHAKLLAIDGLELHATNPDGRMVVTIESDDRNKVAETLYRINTAENVLSASLVYEQSESENTEAST
ncbi:MAG: chaperone NapD [Gammaproteobacteria bacterium]|nr:chaperone NapD [Gammaproteobacteria bacterium]